MSNIEQTTPSLRRGWMLRTHGACSETRILSRACLAKHVRLQLMLGGKVTLAGACQSSTSCFKILVKCLKEEEFETRQTLLNPHSASPPTKAWPSLNGCVKESRSTTDVHEVCRSPRRFSPEWSDGASSYLGVSADRGRTDSPAMRAGRKDGLNGEGLLGTTPWMRRRHIMTLETHYRLLVLPYA